MSETEYPQQLIRETNLAQANKSNGLIFSYPFLWLTISLMSDKLTLSNLYNWAVLLTLLALSLYRHKQLTSINTKPAHQWKREFYYLALLNGAIWSIPAAIHIFHEGLTSNSFIWVLVTSGVSIGGAFSMTPNKSLALLYNALMMAPLSIALILSHQEQSTDSGICIAIFLLFTTKLIHNISDTFSAELTARLNLEASRQTLKELNEKDPLTGIYNRGYWTKTFHNEWLRAHREQMELSVLMIDIDYFKQINDTFGHPAGDLCLKNVSQVLEAQCNRATDTVARYGGEEFIILLPNTPLSGAITVAEEISNNIKKQEHVDHNGKSFKITVSIGIATTIPDNTNQSEQLLIEADNKLYTAKRNGRDRIVSI